MRHDGEFSKSLFINMKSWSMQTHRPLLLLLLLLWLVCIVLTRSRRAGRVDTRVLCVPTRRASAAIGQQLKQLLLQSELHALHCLDLLQLAGSGQHSGVAHCQLLAHLLLHQLGSW